MHKVFLIAKILAGISLLLFLATSLYRHLCKRSRHHSRRRNIRAGQITHTQTSWRLWFLRKIGCGQLPRDHDEKRALILNLEEVFENATDSVSDIARTEEGFATPEMSAGTPTSSAEFRSRNSPQLIEPSQYEIYEDEVDRLVVDGLQYTPSGTEYPSDASSVRSTEATDSK
jgi:hypothetical protein